MAVSRRNLILGAGGLVLAGALPASGSEGAAISGRAFGGTWKLLLADGAGAREAAHETGAVLAGIDRAMNPFRADSSISRFNAAAHDGWHETDAALATVTATALRIAALSHGAFDPTVGPDVRRYGFGPVGGGRNGSFRDLEVAQGAVRKHVPDLTLDLCGIAKGYALDAVAARLQAVGIEHFLLEIGGEVISHGHGIHSQPWRIGIARPSGHGIHTRVQAGGLAFATSGDAVNAYMVGGRRYSHTIDPQTGEPVRNDVASVTVAAADGASADALATALTVLGPQRGLELAERLAVPALFLLRRADGVVARSNAAFDALTL